MIISPTENKHDVIVHSYFKKIPKFSDDNSMLFSPQGYNNKSIKCSLLAHICT